MANKTLLYVNRKLLPTLLVVVAAIAFLLTINVVTKQVTLTEPSQFTSAPYTFSVHALQNVSSNTIVFTLDSIPYQYKQLPNTFILGVQTFHNYSFAQTIPSSSANLSYVFNYTYSTCRIYARSGFIYITRNCTTTAYYTPVLTRS